MIAQLVEFLTVDQNVVDSNSAHETQLIATYSNFQKYFPVENTFEGSIGKPSQTVASLKALVAKLDYRI